MPLSTFALVSLDEFKAYAPVSGTGQDPFIESVVNRASDIIEAHLDRKIVSRGSLTEYHTMESGGQRLRTEKLWALEWPILAVASVHEDTSWPRTYGSALALNTEYEIVSANGLIRRLGSGGPTAWASGSRAIRVVYTAGYANTAAVPERIKAVALRLAAFMFKESSRNQHGILSITDATGNFTRLGPATLTKDMQADLFDERRHQVFVTGEAA